MTASTVHVSNIASSTTESELRNFFSFCGRIASLSLTPETGAADSPLSATITFEQESAARTAILLDGTPFSGMPLDVKHTPSVDELAGSHLATSGDIGPDGEIPQEAKPRSVILTEYLANGYVVGEDALQRGIELDKKHQLTATFTSYLNNALATIDSKVHASDRAKAADAQYHLSEKAGGATKGLQRYFEQALGTSVGQKIRHFYQTSEKEVLDIHQEAKRLAELKKQKRKSVEVSKSEQSCTCDNGIDSEGSCKCEPGSCKCEGCKNKQAAKTGQAEAAVSEKTQFV